MAQSTLTIADLPPEILSYLLSKLSGPTIAKVAVVCKQFYEASRIETVWQHRCLEDYGFTNDNLHGWGIESFRLIYTKVLYPYGHVVGVWQPQIGSYGGLVSIKVRDGALRATQHLPPVDPRVCMPLRVKDLFQIRLSSEGYAQIECLKGPKGPHKLQILPGNGEDEFVLKCCKPEKHRYHESRQEELQEWIREEIGAKEGEILLFNYDHHIELLRIKYIILNQYDENCAFQKLNIPGPQPNVPIQPGLFKGTYGGHGIEIICLKYEEDKLRGYKVTGDPNVPACQLSIEVHLEEPMVLTKAEQETLALVESVDKDSVIIHDPKDLPLTQSFLVPAGVHDHGMADVGSKLNMDLKRCRQRYFGTGLIAMHGFRNSSRTPCHFILFSEDVFALLWLELHSISIFHRVCELI
ncbi:F-box only protein 31-like [Acanthaster planci]|uniref:F-box only protein 31-like n=1 Tax=Acanthaster planci TaxID=133434 RepID=A0A8B7XN38_ACAPL|nr:F-box only protein 31-like [Acanthaster planci]